MPINVVQGSGKKGVSGYNKLLIEFGEGLFKNSLPTIQEFAKQMLTLTSALFAAYFPILEFLSKDSIALFPVVKGYMPFPPIFFILGIVAFVIAILPLKTKIALNIPKQIETDRLHILTVKYWAIYFGMGLLMTGLSITIWIFVSLISS